MSTWTSVPLSSLVAPGRAISYGIVQPGAPTTDGVPIVRVADIRNGRISLDTPLRVSAEIEATHARTRLKGGELLLTLVGTVGQTAVAPPEIEGWNVARAVAVVPVREDVGSHWVKLAIESAAVRERINARLNTTVQATLNLADVAQLPILLPSESERGGIINVIGALDDTIELNRRMSQTLESIAQTIFKSWFVGFDPARVKASAMIAERTLAIGDGYRAKNEELGLEGLPFIRAAELNNGFDTVKAERLRPDRVAAAKGKLSMVGDVAFTSKGTVGRFARVGEHTEPFVYSPQVCFWRSLRPELLHPAVLYCWMQTDEYVAQLQGAAGQTDMAPYVSLRDQKAMEVPRFPESQFELGERLSPMFSLQSLLRTQTATLLRIREALLPPLLRGELQVPEGATA
jgi:type I restriction enzyme S subunit